MTVWTRVLYCEPSPRGDVFTLLERARGSHAIRRSAGMPLTEADARNVLAALGETREAIDAMIVQARAMPSASSRPSVEPRSADQ